MTSRGKVIVGVVVYVLAFPIIAAVYPAIVLAFFSISAIGLFLAGVIP